MKVFECERWTGEFHDWTENKELNPYIVETAGFQPLEVQIERFEQSGLRAKFRSDMFDSSDYRDMYLNPDCRINSDDELEDVERKLSLQMQIRQGIIQRKLAGMQGSAARDGASVANDGRSEADAASGESPAAGAGVSYPDQSSGQ